jgi:nucleoside-diphosphate-sugar epimerase
MKVSVTGAGGFIGGHLVKSCLDLGYEVKAYDKKPKNEWYQRFKKADNYYGKKGDMTNPQITDSVTQGVNIIYNLAEDMGGIGYCHNNHLMTGLSGKIHINLIESILKSETKPHVFYSSSACVYNDSLQSDDSQDTMLKESDAWPAHPDLLYGLNKLYCEELYRYLNKEFGIPVTIARFHNVYGPHGSWKDGREKAPAASIRKVLEYVSMKSDHIEIWGDGKQRRSFVYIDDVIIGVHKLVNNKIQGPVNLGSSQGVTIQYLHDLVMKISDTEIIDSTYEYKLNAPQGVKSRNSDNTLIKQLIDWEPSIKLEDGMKKTFKWIEKEFNKENK